MKPMAEHPALAIAREVARHVETPDDCIAIVHVNAYDEAERANVLYVPEWSEQAVQDVTDTLMDFESETHSIGLIAYGPRAKQILEGIEKLGRFGKPAPSADALERQTWRELAFALAQDGNSVTVQNSDHTWQAPQTLFGPPPALADRRAALARESATPSATPTWDAAPYNVRSDVETGTSAERASSASLLGTRMQHTEGRGLSDARQRMSVYLEDAVVMTCIVDEAVDNPGLFGELLYAYRSGPAEARSTFGVAVAAAAYCDGDSALAAALLERTGPAPLRKEIADALASGLPSEQMRQAIAADAQTVRKLAESEQRLTSLLRQAAFTGPPMPLQRPGNTLPPPHRGRVDPKGPSLER